MATRSAVPFENAAEMLRQLGNVAPERVRMRPPPGQATEHDLFEVNAIGNRLYELVDGTLVEKTMGFSESVLASLVSRLMGNFVAEHDLGVVAGADASVQLLKGLVRLPDVSFVAWNKLPGRALPAKPTPNLVPDLAVEVLSRGNTPEEIERKLGEYFLAGARLVWIIDPRRRTAAVYLSADAPAATLTENDSLDGGDVLPGFRLPLRELFADLPSKPKKTRKKKS